MVERGKRFGFLLKLSETIGVARELGRQDLDGDASLQNRIAGAIHLAHAATSGERTDFVDAEPRADLDGQSDSMLPHEAWRRTASSNVAQWMATVSSRRLA